MTSVPIGADRRHDYAKAQSFQRFLGTVTANAPLWAAVTRRASVSEALAEVARRIPGDWHLQFREVAWWGPRPHDLQRWRTSEGAKLPVTDRYLEMRRWCALDRGRSSLEEVLQLLCDAAGIPERCAVA